MLNVMKIITKPLKYSSTLKLRVITICNSQSFLPRKMFSDSCITHVKPHFIESNFLKAAPKLFPGTMSCSTVPVRLQIYHIRLFRSSERRYATPAFFLVVVRPFLKLAAIIFGRTLRRWWQALPPDKKQLYINKLQMYKKYITGVVAVFTASVVHFYLSHLEQEPITKRWRLILFSREQMSQIADMELDVLVEQYRDDFLNVKDKRYTRVVKVANRILEANNDVMQLPSTSWRVTVVDHPSMKNAFVLPNGVIFVFTAMLSLCDNDDQLGVILAHEMSHALLGHMAEQMSNVQLIEWLMLIPVVIIWAVLPDGLALVSQWLSGQLASLIFHLPFSRYCETEADLIGLKLTARACFDVREATVFWNKMSLFQEFDGNSQPVEWFSTHPSYETRISSLDSMMPQFITLREKCDCPKLSDHDPRAVWNTAKTILLRAKRNETTR